MSQGAQTRTFAYDSLKRLTSAVNPESGTISYVYDANSNVAGKTDARGTTSYAYDALNRLLYKNYTDTSTVRACYAYDGYGGWGDTMTNAVGRLTSSWSVQYDGGVVAGHESYQWDAMGRLQAGRQCTPGTCGSSSYPVHAAYNLAGSETGYWDSSVARYSTYDNAGRVQNFTAGFSVTEPGTSWTPGTGSQNLLTGAVYSAVGLTQATLGNGLTETRAYNSRAWLSSLAISSSRYSVTLGYAGNGNVLTAADSVNGSWTYTYDGVNRLGTALWPTQSSFSYSYDRYGNMSCVQNIQGGQPCTPALAFNAANNRITNTGYTYDAAGNLLSDTAHQYHYDGENRIDCVGTDANGNCLTTSVYYYYDAQGRRVGKQQGNVLEEYVYDLAGNITSVHDGSGNLVRWELYGGGRHVATRDSSGTLSWNHADWLGTERVRTSSTGTTAEQCTDMPFGMNLNCTPSPDLSPMHFTGKQRDTESALDNFGARYYGGGNNLGRFITPDEPFSDQAPGDPQSWSLYAYVRNNPLRFWDPTGLACVVGPNGDEQDDTSGGQTCEEAHEADKQKDPDATVTATPDPVSTETDPINAEVSLVEERMQNITNISPAANDATPWYSKPCVQNALFKGALSIGFDSIGLIPEAGGVARAIGHGAGYRGVVADRLGHKVIDSFGKTTSAVQGSNGLSDTSPEGLVSTGLTVVGFIPGAGQAAAVGSIIMDTYKIAKAINECR